MVLAIFFISTAVLRRETDRFEVSSVGLMAGGEVFRKLGDG
jgi:hypothetical protein